MDRKELTKLLVDIGSDDGVVFVKMALDQIDEWIARGDGCAVYRNAEIGHPEAGHLKFVSFGGPQAQLEVPDPPKTLPDIGDEINWRYQLVGTYTGEKAGG